MTYTVWKFLYTKYKGTTSTEITEIFNPQVIVNLGDAKNSFSFDVNNFSGRYNNYFNPNDRIDIYRVVNNGSTASSDILMVATVRDTSVEVNGQKNRLRVEGFDYTEAILSAVSFGDYQNTPINTAIQQAITFANTINSGNFQVTWDSGNPSTRHVDGAAFPNVGERFFYSPIRNLVEKYSSNRYTGDDVDYYFYIDKNNHFIWKPRLSTASWSFDISTQDIISVKLAKDLKDVKNFIILKGGLLPNNNQVQIPYRDMASISKHGMKYYIAVSNNANAKKFNSMDLSKSYSTTSPTSAYPVEFDGAGGFTTAWVSSYTGTIDGVSMTEGSTVTINKGTGAANKTAYNAVLKKHVETLLTKEGKAICDLYRWGKLKVDLELRPGKVTWVLGDVVQITIPMLSSSAKPMRIKEIQYTEDSDTYSLEEDVGTI